MTQMNLFTKQKQTHRRGRQTCGYPRREVVAEGETGRWGLTLTPHTRQGAPRAAQAPAPQADSPPGELPGSVTMIHLILYQLISGVSYNIYKCPPPEASPPDLPPPGHHSMPG